MTPLRGIGILLLYFGAGLIILQIEYPLLHGIEEAAHVKYCA